MPKPTDDQTGAERPEAEAETPQPVPPGTEAQDAPEDRPEPVADDVPVPSQEGIDPAPAPEPEAGPEPAHPRAEPAAEDRGRSGGVILPVLLGAALGAGASLFAVGAGLVPLPPDPAVTELRGQIADAGAEARRVAGATEELRATLAPLAEDVAALRGAEAPAPVDLAPLADRITALETGLAAVNARLSDLEARPVEGGAASAAALEAFGREMETLRAEVEAARQAGTQAEDRLATVIAEAEERIATREAEVEERAAAEAAAAEARRAETALAGLSAALDSDRPVAPALAELSAAGVDLPPELQDLAEPPTLAELQAGFPEAARQALAAALKAGADGDFGDRALAFLRAQTGARSLTPREGEDADAVLSRAEAALGRGELAAALAELEALPAEARAEMTGWIQRAEARRAVADAIAALAARQG